MSVQQDLEKSNLIHYKYLTAWPNSSIGDDNVQRSLACFAVCNRPGYLHSVEVKTARMRLQKLLYP